MGLLASQITKESSGAGHRDSICLISCANFTCPVTDETGRGEPWGGREEIRKKGRN